MRPRFPLSAILGGLSWLLLHVALLGAWERGSSFPTYEFLNALRALPLALMAFALYGIYSSIKGGRISFIISLCGFALLAAGAAVEFWFGGGVRDGDVDTLSLGGWLTYLIGYLVLAIGLVTFSIPLFKHRVEGKASALLLFLAIAWAAWFPLIMLGQATGTNLADLAQFLFGVLWVVLGVRFLWEGNAIPRLRTSHDSTNAHSRLACPG